MIDLSDKEDMISRELILTARFMLTQEDIVNALHTNEIFVNGRKYHTPMDQLFKITLDNKFGLVELKLTEII